MKHITLETMLDLLDNNLSESQKNNIKKHLQICSACNNKLGKLSVLDNVIRTGSNWDFPETIQPDAKCHQYLKSWGYERYKEVLEARKKKSDILQSIKAVLANLVEIPQKELLLVRKEEEDPCLPYCQQYATEKIKIDLTVSRSDESDKRNLQSNITFLEDKKPVAGSDVSLIKNLETVTTIKTNKRGYFSIDNIACGEYSLKISLDAEEVFVEPLMIK